MEEAGRKMAEVEADQISEKEWMPTLLLCLFLGLVGGHRFYVGKVGTGILWLFTGGFFAVGALYDLYKIITNSFEDKDGNVIIKNWLRSNYIFFSGIIY